MTHDTLFFTLLPLLRNNSLASPYACLSATHTLVRTGYALFSWYPHGYLGYF